MDSFPLKDHMTCKHVICQQGCIWLTDRPTSFVIIFKFSTKNGHNDSEGEGNLKNKAMKSAWSLSLCRLSVWQNIWDFKLWIDESSSFEDRQPPKFCDYWIAKLAPVVCQSLFIWYLRWTLNWIELKLNYSLSSLAFAYLWLA